MFPLSGVNGSTALLIKHAVEAVLLRSLIRQAAALSDYQTKGNSPVIRECPKGVLGSLEQIVV